MKVKIEIELEMENDGGNPIFTKEQMLNALCLQESEVVDGFEVTTDFDYNDNTNNFYIKPYSARIVSKEMLDIAEEFTASQLDVQDLEIEENGTSVTSYIGTYFDVNKKFAVNVGAEDSSWVNFYARYAPESNELSCFYYVSKENSQSETMEYFPTEQERNMIISVMEGYCQKEYRSTIMEFLEEFNAEQNEDIGGMSL